MGILTLRTLLSVAISSLLCIAYSSAFRNVGTFTSTQLPGPLVQSRFASKGLSLAMVGLDGAMRKTGRILWYDQMKGWGHIQPDDGSGVVHIRQKNIRDGSVRNMFVEGEKVEYQLDAANLQSGAKDVISVDPMALSQAPQYMAGNSQLQQQAQMLRADEMELMRSEDLAMVRRIEYLENLLQMPTCPSCTYQERIEQLEAYAAQKSAGRVSSPNSFSNYGSNSGQGLAVQNTAGMRRIDSNEGTSALSKEERTYQMKQQQLFTGGGGGAIAGAAAYTGPTGEILGGEGDFYGGGNAGFDAVTLGNNRRATSSGKQGGLRRIDSVESTSAISKETRTWEIQQQQLMQQRGLQQQQQQYPQQQQMSRGAFSSADSGLGLQQQQQYQQQQQRSIPAQFSPIDGGNAQMNPQFLQQQQLMQQQSSAGAMGFANEAEEARRVMEQMNQLQQNAGATNQLSNVDTGAEQARAAAAAEEARIAQEALQQQEALLRQQQEQQARLEQERLMLEQQQEQLRQQQEQQARLEQERLMLEQQEAQMRQQQEQQEAQVRQQQEQQEAQMRQQQEQQMREQQEAQLRQQQQAEQARLDQERIMKEQQEAQLRQQQQAGQARLQQEQQQQQEAQRVLAEEEERLRREEESANKASEEEANRREVDRIMKEAEERAAEQKRKQEQERAVANAPPAQSIANKIQSSDSARTAAAPAPAAPSGGGGGSQELTVVVPDKGPLSLAIRVDEGGTGECAIDYIYPQCSHQAVRTGVKAGDVIVSINGEKFPLGPQVTQNDVIEIMKKTTESVNREIKLIRRERVDSGVRAETAVSAGAKVDDADLETVTVTVPDPGPMSLAIRVDEGNSGKCSIDYIYPDCKHDAIRGGLKSGDVIVSINGEEFPLGPKVTQNDVVEIMKKTTDTANRQIVVKRKPSMIGSSL